jgi:hypothetical protein
LSGLLYRYVGRRGYEEGKYIHVIPIPGTSGAKETQEAPVEAEEITPLLHSMGFVCSSMTYYFSYQSLKSYEVECRDHSALILP